MGQRAKTVNRPKKTFKSDGTPESPFYRFVFFLVKLVFGDKPKPQYELNGFEKVEPPYVLLSNHESFYDFYYLYKLPHKRKPLYVINRYYCNMPFLSFLNKRVCMIPKKVFFDDMATPLRIKRTIRKGVPVIIYPEGRLCIDGRTNRITEKGGDFYKSLGVDIVLTRVNGAFYEKPKWRKKRYYTPVTITVAGVISKEQAASMSSEELDKMITDTIRNDATLRPLARYPQPDKAEGLHNILYRCYACDGLYTTSSLGNTITCSSCGRSFTLGDDYQFIEEPHTMAAWYDHMTEVELKTIKDIDLKADVTTVIYSNKGKKRKERASMRLTYDGFSYESSRVSFTYPMDKLQGILFTSGEHIETYYDDEMYFLCPDTVPLQCTRWAHIVDIIKTIKESEQRDERREQTDRSV